MNFKNLSGGEKSGIAYSAFITLYLVIALIVQSIAGAVLDKTGLVYRLVCSVCVPLSAIAVVTFFKVLEKRSLFSVINVKKFSSVYIAVAVCISAGMFFGLGFLNILIDGWLGGKNSSDLPLTDVTSLILLILTVAVLPAVFEEIIFRGVMQNYLSGIKPYISMLFIGLSFAIFHGSISQLVYQFIYGFTLAFLTYKAGSVIPAIISHFINNFVIILLTFLGVGIDFFNGLIISGGLVLLAGALLFLIFYKRQAKREYIDNKKNLLGFLVYASMGVLISVALIVGGLMV